MNKKKFKSLQNGQVVIITVLILVTVSIIVIYAIANPLISSYHSTQGYMNSKQAFIISNSAGEEALYRLKNKMNLPASEEITINGQSAAISTTNTFDGKTITVGSEVKSYERQLQIKIIEETGVSFSYGLQSGRGGFQMSGGARIDGNVYSNGNITGSGGPIITGSATVATRSNPGAIASNGITFPPPHDLIFGGQLVWNEPNPEDIAQSFQMEEDMEISSLRFYIKKYANAWMNDIAVRITNDSGGKPGKTTLASATLQAQQITTSYNYLSTPLNSPVNLEANETYWIVLDTSNTWGSYYILASSLDTFDSGQAKVGQWKSNNGGTWNNTVPTEQDFYFDIYSGGDTGLISGITIGQDGGNAWAHTVNNSNVYGVIYCQASAGNNKPCDTSRPDPAEQPMPISEGNIEDWKNEATNGGTFVGNITLGGSDFAELGPQKIVGDLNVGSGAVLHITGTLYVTGNVSVSGGAVIRLSPSYESTSGIIVTDGRVSASGGGQFQGSGQSGSYILVVTTSTCPDGGGCGNNPAIKVSGGTGAVVLNAQYGTIEFNGGAQAKQATGYQINMSGGTTVNYESGLSSLDFSSGPAGSWNVTSWNEI